jgi:hypothetical protein
MSRRAYKIPIIDGKKECGRCAIVKPLEEFSKRGDFKHMYRSECKPCSASRNTYESGRKAHLRAEYGMVQEEYLTLLHNQGSLCAICDSDTSGNRYLSFYIDHDHKTNKVRGLLCDRCNRGLGYFLDNPSFLRSAALYLEKHKEEAEYDNY